MTAPAAPAPTEDRAVARALCGVLAVLLLIGVSLPWLTVTGVPTDPRVAVGDPGQVESGDVDLDPVVRTTTGWTTPFVTTELLPDDSRDTQFSPEPTGVYPAGAVPALLLVGTAVLLAVLAREPGRRRVVALLVVGAATVLAQLLWSASLIGRGDTDMPLAGLVVCFWASLAVLPVTWWLARLTPTQG